MDEDDQAIGRVRAGDREAFRSLVERHQSSVCATIRALMPQSADWEDVAQEVFLAAFRHLATFDSSKGSFRTWLLTIARNQCRNRWKRLTLISTGIVPEGVDRRTPEMAASESEWFEKLDAGLAALPEEQRLVFVLIEMQGLSYEEAADIAGCNPGTVKSRLSRAKEWLREILGSSRSVRRGSPDPAEAPTAGLPALQETCGQRLWLGRETGHNRGRETGHNRGRESGHNRGRETGDNEGS